MDIKADQKRGEAQQRRRGRAEGGCGESRVVCTAAPCAPNLLILWRGGPEHVGLSGGSHKSGTTLSEHLGEERKAIGRLDGDAQRTQSPQRDRKHAHIANRRARWGPVRRHGSGF